MHACTSHHIITSIPGRKEIDLKKSMVPWYDRYDRDDIKKLHFFYQPTASFLLNFSGGGRGGFYSEKIWSAFVKKSHGA